MNQNRELFITGLGVVSPIGIGPESFWGGLVGKISGVAVRSEFEGTSIPLRLAAKIKDFDPKNHIENRKSIKIMCLPIQHGCAAAMMAFRNAGFAADSLNPDRLGTLFGTETFFADPQEVADVFRHCTIDKDYQHDRWGEFAMRKIQPLWMLKYLPNMAASHISIMLDARGHSNSICQGEVSGLIALIEAAHVIQRGWCDVVVVGGTGSMCELSAMLYRGNNLSRAYADHPEQASRPFDLKRDGIVPGEGAAALILESAAHAARRGARPLAKLAGWAMTFGTPDQATFSGSIADCFQIALEHAGLPAAQIGSINADASGRLFGDAAEAQAIRQVFGDTPVVANKGHFGNLGPGTSLVETVAAILSLQHRCLPPTMNFEFPDPQCPVNVSSGGPLEQQAAAGLLKSSISETGQIASIILTPPPQD
jgi:3-oxoacyl-[acyl-carrier-protein] synthase II